PHVSPAYTRTCSTRRSSDLRDDRRQHSEHAPGRERTDQERLAEDEGEERAPPEEKAEDRGRGEDGAERGRDVHRGTRDRDPPPSDRKSTRLNSSHVSISYDV